MRTKITKAKFYNIGGLANPNLHRQQAKSGRWSYYKNDGVQKWYDTDVHFQSNVGPFTHTRVYDN